MFPPEQCVLRSPPGAWIMIVVLFYCSLSTLRWLSPDRVIFLLLVLLCFERGGAKERVCERKRGKEKKWHTERDRERQSDIEGKWERGRLSPDRIIFLLLVLLCFERGGEKGRARSCLCEREREKERETEWQRWRARARERKTERERDKKRKRQTDSDAGKHVWNHAGKHVWKSEFEVDTAQQHSLGKSRSHAQT